METPFTADPDMEAAKPQPQPPTTSPILLLEAGALLLLWSVLVINEGAIRLIGSNPADDLLASRLPGEAPRFVLFLGGLFEVFFGIIGVFLGIAAFLKRWHNETYTKAAMVVQTLLGYYVFVVYVFIVPGFKASNLAEPTMEGLSLGQSRFLIALGVLTSFHFCLALQGGQFVFMARLVTAATGKDFLKQKTGARMRAMFWNSNLAFSGLWTIITGALINANVGGGKLDAPFVSPPNVGVLPGVTISTGTTMLLWGLTGVALAVARWELPLWYYIGSGYVYGIALLNFGIVQFGVAGIPAAAGSVALHNGLVFMVTFIATYFSHLASEEQKAASS